MAGAHRVAQLGRIASRQRDDSGGQVVDVDHRRRGGAAERLEGAVAIGVAGFDPDGLAHLRLAQHQAGPLPQQRAAGIPAVADAATDPIGIAEAVAGLQSGVLGQRTPALHRDADVAAGGMVDLIDHHQHQGGADAVALTVIDAVAQLQRAAVAGVIVSGSGIELPAAIGRQAEPVAVIGGQVDHRERIVVGVLEAGGELRQAEGVGIARHQVGQHGRGVAEGRQVEGLVEAGERHPLHRIPVGEKVVPLVLDAEPASGAAVQQACGILDVAVAVDDLPQRLRIGGLVVDVEGAGIHPQDRRHISAIAEIETAATGPLVEQRQGQLVALLIVGERAEDRHLHLQFCQGQRRDGVTHTGLQNLEGVAAEQIARFGGNVQGGADLLHGQGRRFPQVHGPL